MIDETRSWGQRGAVVVAVAGTVLIAAGAFYLLIALAKRAKAVQRRMGSAEERC